MKMCDFPYNRFSVSVVEKVSPLERPVVAAVSPGRASRTADQSQGHPGEGPTQELPEPRAVVRRYTTEQCGHPFKRQKQDSV